MNNQENTNFFGVERKSETGRELREGVEDCSGTPKKFANEAPGAISIGYLGDTYVSPKPKKRIFKADEKIAICEEAAKAQRGQVGSVLRKYGIYWSQLTTWRKLFRLEGRDGLTGRNRKKEKKAIKDLESENKHLKRENEKLAKRLKQSEMIIEVQKKISEILEIPQPDLNQFGKEE
jgi:transposase-like protein